MCKKKYGIVFVILVLLFSCLSGCQKTEVLDSVETTVSKESVPTTEPEGTGATEDTTEPEETLPATPVDIHTVGGAVIVGVIGYDAQGWYLLKPPLQYP